MGKQLEIIVLRCQNGDTDAFEELFERYQPRLKYYIRRLDSTGANTDDTLQDIWLTVFRKIHKLKDANSFPIWLYRIARNKVYGKFRQKRTFIRLPKEEHLPELPEDEPVFSADDAEQLHMALNNIQPYHREVITLYFLERLSYQAIAEIVGCSLGTIKSRIHFAKKSLRKELESKNG